jgi:hypothetical protein
MSKTGWSEDEGQCASCGGHIGIQEQVYFDEAGEMYCNFCGECGYADEEAA